MSTGIFEGVRIVELAQYVFVPASAAVLSDLGADVIKVEPTTGDVYRGLHPAAESVTAPSARFHHANRGKRSIAVDIRHEEGREILLQLVAEADVFMTSVRAAALTRAGLGVEDLRARNERLIYCRGHGLGIRGPDAGRPGFDATAFWARGGLAASLGLALDGKPVRQLGAMGDNPGAMNLAFAVAAALFERERTGTARVVDVSLLATALWTLAGEVLTAQSPQTNSVSSAWNPLTETYATRDGRWLQFVLLEPDRYWAEFCDALGRPDLTDDERYKDQVVRKANGEACVKELAAIFLSADYNEWRRRLAPFGGPWEPQQTVAELLTDPQVTANGYLAEVEGDGTRLVSPPAQFDETPVATRPGPNLGEDTNEILADLGYTAEARDDLRTRGVIR